jgi:hypothetical protein
MAIVPQAEMLEYLDITAGYFEITAGNDVLILTYDDGSATEIDVADGTYSGAAAATALKTAIDSAFTISSTVTYSSTTKKFTLDAGAGHTFAYTHSGSDGGLTFGFNDDHSASRTITSNLAAGDPTAIATVMQETAEAYIKEKCGRDFESTTYNRRMYSGKGSKFLFLGDAPVTAFSRLSIDLLDIVDVYNTNAYTTASVSVTSTGVVLELNGTTDSTVTFESYTTLATLVAAINALGNGWYAKVINSLYNSYASNELVEAWGKSCINSKTASLRIPNTAISEFNLFPDTGKIYYSCKIPKGIKNVTCSFTAGYSADDMPEDLKFGVKQLTQYLLQKYNEQSYGLERFNVNDIEKVFSKNSIPNEVAMIIWKYKRVKV